MDYGGARVRHFLINSNRLGEGAQPPYKISHKFRVGAADGPSVSYPRCIRRRPVYHGAGGATAVSAAAHDAGEKVSGASAPYPRFELFFTCRGAYSYKV